MYGRRTDRETGHKFVAVARHVNILGYIFYMKTEKARKITAWGNYDVKNVRRAGEERGRTWHISATNFQMFFLYSNPDILDVDTFIQALNWNWKNWKLDGLRKSN